MKTNPLQNLKDDARADWDNDVFPSKEDDGIEHMDMSYEEFFSRLDTLIEKVVAAVEEEVLSEMDKTGNLATVSKQRILQAFRNFRTHE